ncbi:MAG: glycosyltransferase family 9 protein [bacterium]
MNLHRDCRHFQGDRPCKPHKEFGVHCDGCDHYDKVKERILIVKLGAAGDVIRTTPLLRRLRQEYPSAHITWLSDFPELLPSAVDRPVKLNERTLTWLRTLEFDLACVLDKDPEAIALAERVKAVRKVGFGMDEWGHARALNPEAEDKIVTGIFDDVSRANTKSYPQEILELCGFDYRGERYMLERKVQRDWKLPNRHPLIGLNTGSGGRWISRMWPEEHWAQLGIRLQKAGCEILWLGGLQEDERNLRLLKQAGGTYAGHFSLEEFVDLMAHTDVVVTQVTMAFHIAIGLERRVVLMNNIFNPNEFELYGLGRIVEPDPPCDCYYTPVCPHDSMKNITPAMVFEAVQAECKSL